MHDSNSNINTTVYQKNANNDTYLFELGVFCTRQLEIGNVKNIDV